MQFCVCDSTIAKQERFRLRSKRNEHPFNQSDAVGSAEIDCVFFFFGSLFLFSSQQKRKSEHIKLYNLSILTIDVHNIGHVTNCLTCTAMTQSVIPANKTVILRLKAEESRFLWDTSG